MNEHFLAASLILGLASMPTPAAPPQVETIQYEAVGDGNCPDGTCPRRPVVNAVKSVAEPVKAIVAAPVKVVQSVACPDGKCPTVRKVQTVQPTIRESRIVQSGPNWNYYGSGTLRQHVQNDHGIDTTGMTPAQVQQAHNAAHSNSQVYSAVNRQVRVYQAKPVRSALRRVFCR